MDIISYDLRLDVDFTALSFQGNVKIRVHDCDGKLLLDSVDHEIRSVRANGNTTSFVKHDQASTSLEIPNLPKGSVYVDIDYEGKVNQNSLHGLYMSRFSGGYVLATDFEPTGARMLLPCLDNPSFRAVFNLELIIDDDLKAISNTPIKEIVPFSEPSHDASTKKRRVLVRFEPTPKMSTYIFFLGIGKFDEEKIKLGSIDLIGAATRGNAHKTRYALENAGKFLDTYKDYYSIAYPLQKLHLIALPEYGSGAMENWGAITFREHALLVDENSSITNRRNVVRIVGHEVAHQWFGNLVTMKWWNDLWLNESFATFLETKVSEKLYPEWKNWNDFLLGETEGAMHGDSLENTHPIDVSVKDPDEISAIFDEISYGKGSSILRMIEAYLGDEPFRQGIATYLERFKYSNAEGRDLWKSLEESSNQPVEKVMEAWIKKPGYPVVGVETNEDGALYLSQSRFLLSGKEDDAEPWPIPLTMLADGKTIRLLMDQKRVKMDGFGKPRQLKMNLDQTGFYRVQYSDELYFLLETEFEGMGDIDRYGIIDDLFSFVLSGRQSPDLYFRFARKCFGETSYIIVNCISNQLGLLYHLAPKSPTVLSSYREFLMSQMTRLGVSSKQGECDDDKILRGRIAQGLAQVDQRFASALSERFGNYSGEDPNIRTAIAISYALTEGEDAFLDMTELAKKIGNEGDVIKLLWGLTAFREPALVKKGLDFSLSGEINRADSIYAIGDASTNIHARSALWEWFTQNFGTIRELFKGTAGPSFVLEEIIPSVGLEREREVREYFNRTSIPEGERGIRKGLELLSIYSRVAEKFKSF